MAINRLGNHTGKKKHNFSKVSRYLFNSFYIRSLQKQLFLSHTNPYILNVTQQCRWSFFELLGHLCWHKLWKIKITPIM